MEAIVIESQKPMDTWGNAETHALMRIYKEYEKTLEDPKTKAQGWQMVSSRLEAEGYHKEPRSCRTKWQNLIRTYKAIKINQKKTGQGPKRFGFFDEIEEIVRNNPNYSYSKLVRNVYKEESSDTVDPSVDPSINQNSNSNEEISEVAETTPQFDVKIVRYEDLTKKSEHAAEPEMEDQQTHYIDDHQYQQNVYIEDNNQECVNEKSINIQLERKRIKLQIENEELLKYKRKLEIIKLERELGFPRSSCTKTLP